jgi:hypothetical protein
MKNKWLLFVLATFVFTNIAIFSENSAKEPADEAAILFAKTYENYAWGNTYEGITIDSKGRIHSFSYPHDRPPFALLPENSDNKASKKGSADAIREKYKPGRKLLKTIDPAEVKKMTCIAASATTATMTKEISQGRDMGKYSWIAYVYNADTGKYRGLVLKIDGDFSSHRKSEDAKAIIEWLDSLK